MIRKSLEKMEEKLSILESYVFLKGLISRKNWNVLQERKSLSKESQLSGDSQEKETTKVIQFIKDEGISSVKEWYHGGNIEEGEEEEEREENVLKYDNMETNKSDTDIPEELEEILPGDDGTKEKTADCDNSIDVDHRVDTHGDKLPNGLIQEEFPSAVQDWVNHLPSNERRISREAVEKKEEGHDNPSAVAKLSREASLQSSSSLDSILDSRRPDPVEIFLNLGFGGTPGVNMENCRIPKRFLVPSKCKGGDWNEFLRRELLQAQNFECSSLGFRGLSGPSYRRPSAIVANIMEKLRERTVPHQSHARSRFSTVAKRVLNEKSVLNKLSSEFQSVLSPDNRKFLQNQGKKSPEVPRRRIIFGQKSFAFAHDGEFVEVESGGGEADAEPDADAGKETPASNDPEEAAPVFPNSEVLLKIRRPSLQKQKKVEEDADPDDVFYIVGNEERSGGSEASYGPAKCSQKAGKIPRRFLSSTNLKALEENVLSDAMRLEVEKEILGLSQKVKSISNQDLPSVLKQVKQLSSQLENAAHEPPQV